MQFKDFDILHMMGRHAAIPSLPARKSSFKKKIYHVHNIYPWGMRGDTRPINYYKDLLYERIATNISDEVIVPSTYLVNLVSRVSLKPQNKVCVLPNGVDPEKFNPDINGRGIRKRYSLGDSTVITYIGRITPLKGIHHLIEAFSLLKKDLFNVRLFIIGPIWRPNYYTYLCNLIKDLKLNGSVMFTGPVKHELIPNYLAATDIFVFPTLGEGFGLSLLEAMACGKPVITSNVAGVSSLVIDQVTGLLVKPADEHQICQRLRWLIHNKDFTEKMGLNASSYVTKHFSLSAIAKRLRGIYEQMGA
jgi:glycosyltransferase involved in cell wall biosynthesis